MQALSDCLKCLDYKGRYDCKNEDGNKLPHRQICHIKKGMKSRDKQHGS